MKPPSRTYGQRALLFRRFVSIVFSLILLFNYYGYYVWFNVLQHKIRTEIKAMIRNGIKDAELTVIEVQDGLESNISWIKPGKEFTFKGEMFDVVRSKTEHSRTIYYCINDKKEKQLIADFIHKGEWMKKSRRMLTPTFSVYLIPTGSLIDIQIPSDHPFFPPEESLLSKIHEVPYPPPKCPFLV